MYKKVFELILNALGTFDANLEEPQEYITNFIESHGVRVCMYTVFDLDRRMMMMMMYTVCVFKTYPLRLNDAKSLKKINYRAFRLRREVRWNTLY